MYFVTFGARDLSRGFSGNVKQKKTKMASWLPFDNLGFCSAFGRNILVGVSIGLGIGIGIGAGMAASRKWLTAKVEDQNLVIRFTELRDEIRELRCVVVRLEVTLTDQAKNTRIVPHKNEPSLRLTEQSDEETEDEFYEMSGDELPSRYGLCFDLLQNIFNTLYDLLA